MKLSFKTKPSHGQDICDVTKCKSATDIILRYFDVYPDNVVDLCYIHYKQHLEGIENWNTYYKNKIRRHAKEKIFGYKYMEVNTKEETEDKSVGTKEVLYKDVVISSATTYPSIEEYTKQTGKRFRMTKEQKGRNLSRDEAFKELNKPK